MSISNLLPQPSPFTINGKVYNLLPFTINDMAKIQNWIDRTYQSPVRFMDLGSLDNLTRTAVLAQAKSWKPPKLGTEEASEMLQSMEGLCEVFRILLTNADPSTTDEDVKKIQGAYTVAGFVDVAEGLMKVAFGEDSDPKAPVPTSLSIGT